MTFKARLIFPNLSPPIKLYIYELGFKEAFGDIETTQRYFRNLVHKHHHLLNNSMFAIAVMRGYRTLRKGIRVVELFGYEKLPNVNMWPGNPEVYSWVIKNGRYDPQERNIACSETMRVVGREDDFRATTKSLPEYLLGHEVSLKDLEPKLDFIV